MRTFVHFGSNSLFNARVKKRIFKCIKGSENFQILVGVINAPLSSRVPRDDDSTAKDRLRMGARGDDRRRQRVFYIQRTAARVSRREESRGGGRARGEREEAIGKIERCIVV